MNVAYYFQMSDKIVDTIDNSKKTFLCTLQLQIRGSNIYVF